jgi:hypothetical protein
MFFFSGDTPADIRRFHALSADQRSRLAIIAGHAPRLTGIDEIDALPTITFLREPVARVVSFCQHLSEGKSPETAELFAGGDFDLDRLLASAHRELANFQTKVLLGHGDYGHPDGAPEAVGAQAVAVLEDQLAAFGLVERFDLSLLLLRRAMGWRRWPFYRRVNVRDRSRLLAVSDQQRAHIAQRNQIDTLVWQRACQLLTARLAREPGIALQHRLFVTLEWLFNRAGQLLAGNRDAVP